MFYLFSEIALGLLLAMLAGFCFGWITRGIRERIRAAQAKEMARSLNE